MDSIEKEINTKVRKVIINKFAEISEVNLDLESLMVEIKSGYEVIQTLKKTYQDTKREVKEENPELSWDENVDLFKVSDTSVYRLQKLYDCLELVEQLNGLIDNELTQVIGDANFLKDSKEAILEMFKLFNSYLNKLFEHKKNEEDFKNKIEEFELLKNKLEEKIVHTIK